jgi:hypothetical protein
MLADEELEALKLLTYFIMVRIHRMKTMVLMENQLIFLLMRMESYFIGKGKQTLLGGLHLLNFEKL